MYIHVPTLFVTVTIIGIFLQSKEGLLSIILLRTTPTPRLLEMTAYNIEPRSRGTCIHPNTKFFKIHLVHIGPCLCPFHVDQRRDRMTQFLIHLTPQNCIHFSA
jgi:hypothetical protein